MTSSASINADAGRDVTTELTPWQKQALGTQTRMVIRQGFRRRHPHRVLNQFTAVVQGSTNPTEQWENAMIEDTERAELPEWYKKTNNAGYATQIGLVQTALQNFKKSKHKLTSGHLIGS